MASIHENLSKIINAVFGRDIRQALHDGLDAINKETESTTSRQDYLDRKYDEQIKNMTVQDPSSAEIVDMRVAANGKTFEKAGDRLNYFDEQLVNKASKDEVDIERKRIDNLAKIPDGSTEGNAELIDIRVGDDGVNYPLGGEAVRSQFKNIKDVILPYAFLDFHKRAKELNSSSKEIIGTFDTLRVTEKSSAGTGNGGFNIQIPRNVNSIEFDIEHINFGVNCGFYYFKDGSLKTGYKTYTYPVTNELRFIKGVKLEIDWDEVDRNMTANGYDNIRFVAWNATGAVINGYNYFTNIKVNGFRNNQRLNEAVDYIEKEIVSVVKRGEIGISDIRNRTDVVGESSTMVKWGSSSNFIYNSSTGVISFSYDQPTGNKGFQTPVFSCIGSSLRITGEILSLTGNGLSISLSGKTKSENKQVYYSIGGVNKVGKFTIECDIQKLFSQREELILNEISIVFSNSGQVNLTVRNIIVEDLDTLKEGENLERILDNMYSNVPLANVKNENIIIAEAKDLDRWSGGNFTVTNDVLSFTHSTETGNSGVITSSFTSATNFVNVKGKVLSLTKYNQSSKMLVYVVGYNTSGVLRYYTIGEILNTGLFNISVDLNNLVVYHALDLTKSIKILLGSSNKVGIVIEGYTVFEHRIPQSNLITERLDETLINFDKEITSINSKLTSLDGNKNTSLIAPNGSKYILSVDNDGNLFTIPVIPKKVLFIGNSLLLGHGTFGMCAKDSKNDYYYHVKEYLKAFNPEVICDKQHGAPFEQTESQAGINSWIANNINKKATDYDLVVIQLGDNVNNNARNELFKTSCKQLLQAVRTHMPRARVVWVGEWYYTAQRQEIISKGCAETGSTFIDITDLTIKENQGAIGDIITADNGTQTPVTSSGVASHPGNKGMKAIADRLIEELFK